ncbi:MAG: F0F1 ATP synthase subunit B [Elusimicrobia bacterium]|nr:F0F1 ATP synthase subunit B [Elusimicrobiota bacterium]
MDKLLNPDTGLVVWTIVTFLCLVFILKKFAWGPLLASVEDREKRMKSDLEGAQAARAEAERIKNELDGQMANLQAKSREFLAQALKEGEGLKAQLKAAAEAESQKIKDKTMADLADEKQRLVRELRHEVSQLSVLAAERLLRQSVDDRVQKTVLESFFHDLEKADKAH